MQLKFLQAVCSNVYVLPVVTIIIINFIVLDYFGCLSFKLFFTSCLDTFLSIENKNHFLDEVPFLSKILNNEVETTIYIERKVHLIIAIKKGLLITFYAVDVVVQYLDIFFLTLILGCMKVISTIGLQLLLTYMIHDL
jgi:hypothetical protein